MGKECKKLIRRFDILIVVILIKHILYYFDLLLNRMQQNLQSITEKTTVIKEKEPNTIIRIFLSINLSPNDLLRLFLLF